MIHKSSLFTVAAFAVALLLAACGGSGGASSGAGTPTLPPAIASYGTVTAFGSVVVNGVRYDTAAATFTVDGNPATQSDLAVGDVVLVRGTVAASGSTGSAASVVFDDQVQGPVDAIDTAAGTFMVLGQNIRVAADTSFDERIQPATIAGLVVGASVEVSGLPDWDGSIRATRIEPSPAGAELELTGVVAGHQDLFQLFFINRQLIDYSALGQFRSARSGIANGQTLEIKGGSVGGGVWRPASIGAQVNNLGGAAGERREVEGFITRFVSRADFSVGGLAVETNAQTSFSGGAASDLGLNVKIEVEGALNAAGVLVATTVAIRRSAIVRVAAHVDSVTAADASFVVLGVTVRVDALTRIEDQSSQHLRPFGLANLVAGDYVEVRGVEQPAGSGEILAALIEREDAAPATELEGFVQSVVPPNFTILGVAIGTNAGTAFRDAHDVPIDATQFFTELAAGSLANAKGLEVGTRALQATAVQLDN